MKISSNQLKKIIEEEIEKSDLNEGFLDLFKKKKPEEGVAEVVNNLYKMSQDLEKVREDMKGLARVTISGMASDVFNLSARFRKYMYAMKSGDEKQLAAAMSESKSEQISIESLRKVIREVIEKEIKEADGLKDACWSGYEAVGFKKKNGKRVPNCVPKKKKKS